MTIGSNGRLKLLAIEDDPEILDTVRSVLAAEPIETFTVLGAQNGLDRYLELRPNIVVTGLQLRERDGLELLEKILAADPGTEVILVSSDYSTDSAVKAIQKGARDYLTKPIDGARLLGLISGLMVEAQHRHKVLELEDSLLAAFQMEGIIGRSPAMLQVFAKLRRVAPHFRTALVTGATGTGKELVARALHRLSPAASANLAVCNSSALVESLLESELFGHVRGAFTGAVQDKVGLFEYANGGTVFLDEIGDLTLSAQVKLLRVLQNREVQRVGSPITRSVDVRVVAATHRNLRNLVAEGRFREDLFYRLSMVEIEVPRLVDRQEDIPLLQRSFVAKFSQQYQKDIRGITRRAQAALARYAWPGNVRELENVIGNACMMAMTDVIDLPDLPEHVRNSGNGPSARNSRLLTLEEVQQQHLMRVLDVVDGNKARAAEVLGVSRATVYEMLARAKAKKNSAAAV